MSLARQTTPPPLGAARELSKTPMHYASVAASTDPVALLGALQEEIARHVAAAKTRNGLGEDGPGSPELGVHHSDTNFDGSCGGVESDAEELTVDGVPKAIADLRAANAAALGA